MTVTTTVGLRAAYAVTVYPVTAAPPSHAGADQLTVASAGPATAVTASAGSGTSADIGGVSPMTLRYGAAWPVALRKAVQLSTPDRVPDAPSSDSTPVNCMRSRPMLWAKRLTLCHSLALMVL